MSSRSTTSQLQLKLLKAGPSALTSSKSFKVEQLGLVLFSVLIVFSVETNYSALAVEKGKFRSNSLTSMTFGHLAESGEEHN